MFNYNKTIYAEDSRALAKTKVDVNVTFPKEIKINQNNGDVDRISFLLENKDEFVDGVIIVMKETDKKL